MTITPENRKRFEEMGYEMVRLDLLRSFDGGCVIEGRADRLQAGEWVSEQDRKQKRSVTWIAALTLIAAAIAAAPVIKHGIERMIH
jgi:hypothetical protein